MLALISFLHIISWKPFSCWNATLSANYITFFLGGGGSSNPVLFTHSCLTGCRSLKIHINIFIILGFLSTWHVSFASELNCRFYMLISLCSYAQPQCSLLLAKTRKGLPEKPKLSYYLLHHRAEELDLYWICSLVSIAHTFTSWVELSRLLLDGLNSLPLVLVKFLDCLSPIISCLFFLVCSSPERNTMSFLESLKPVLISFKLRSLLFSIAFFNIGFRILL